MNEEPRKYNAQAVCALIGTEMAGTVPNHELSNLAKIIIDGGHPSYVEDDIICRLHHFASDVVTNKTTEGLEVLFRVANLCISDMVSENRNSVQLLVQECFRNPDYRRAIKGDYQKELNEKEIRILAEVDTVTALCSAILIKAMLVFLASVNPLGRHYKAIKQLDSSMRRHSNNEQ